MTNILNFIYPNELINNEIILLDKPHKLKDIIKFVSYYSVNTNSPLFLNQLFGNTDDLSILAEQIISEMNTSMYRKNIKCSIM